MGAKRHLNAGTQEGMYVHTYGHRNSMTESAQWADSVKRESMWFTLKFSFSLIRVDYVKKMPL